MQFAFVICILFTIGDVDKVANSPTGLPIIEVYYQATKSKAAANVLIIMTALPIFLALFNVFASVSRLTWAFARDHGLPFPHIFSAVRMNLSHRLVKAYLLLSHLRAGSSQV
jgi:amino acid transporter